MCVQKDDIADIMAKVKNAEVIVYATPIYYYEIFNKNKVYYVLNNDFSSVFEFQF